MALLAGTRHGIYEIRELIGRGGMGEVYRASDPKLAREVALKILPAMVAAEPERLLRFRREARLLASLNHGNIAAVYGFEESDGTHALVLELVDGPTLAERIARGRIPLEEALPIARQIADALEAAHDHAIIHRDLKPANIKIRPDGAVKVLDFGLAKTLANDADPSDAAASPTITSLALTQLGAILGTAAYMSPEQARGKEADRRSDIWAFGCVLYEMLAGKRAFEGSDGSDTLASVLRSDPDWKALPAQTPHSIRRVLRRCLQKDPRQRLRDIADVRLEIDEPTVEAAEVTGPAAPPGGRTRTRTSTRAAWVLALLSLASLATYVATRPLPAKEVTRFQVYAPPQTVLGSVPGASGATVSPDGTRVVFVALDQGGTGMLWVRPFDAFDAFPLPGSEGASQPFWSPDARAIGFFVANKLKRLEVSGGSPYTICDVVDDITRGASWGSGGDIVFATGSSARLYRVSADGGAPVPLAMQTGQGASAEALWPSFLPDGRTFLYWARTAGGGAGVYAGSIAPGTAPKRLLSGESNAVYDPAGVLLFTRGGVLLRQRFDAARLEVSGEARRVVTEGIASTESLGFAAFSVSNTGVLLFQPESGRATQFAWFDRNGRMLETVGEPGAYRFPSLSPDETRLLYTDLRDGSLRILDLVRKITSRVPTGPGSKFSPVWSPDGSTIVYRSAANNGVTAFFEKRLSGTGEPRLLLEGSLYGPTQISPDGNLLLYFGNPEGPTLQDIFVLPMTGERTPQRIVQSPSADVEPQWSLDGKLMAYVSSTTGRREVHVQPFPATGESWQVSNTGGRQPLWRKDGKELFFVGEDRKFYAVDITLSPRFDYGTPRFLFEMRANVWNARNSYIPSPDGQRFLVNMALETDAPAIHVVRNWAAGLKD